MHKEKSNNQNLTAGIRKKVEISLFFLGLCLITHFRNPDHNCNNDRVHNNNNAKLE